MKKRRHVRASRLQLGMISSQICDESQDLSRYRPQMGFFSHSPRSLVSSLFTISSDLFESSSLFDRPQEPAKRMRWVGWRKAWKKVILSDYECLGEGVIYPT